LDKCASLSIKRGVAQEAVVTLNLDEILPLNEGLVYKYLGVLENNVFDTTKMKTAVQQEFLRRPRVVLQTQLNAGIKVKGFNMFAVPIQCYAAA